MNGQRGFTLVETVIFILVLAVGLTGLVSLSTTATKESATPLIRERTLVIAHGYMDEIISKRWDENTPVGGGCVDTDLASPNDRCTIYCAALNDLQCSRSKCNLAAPATCQAAANVSAALGPDGVPAETRPIFDDIDDYHDPVGTVPRDILGNAVPGYAGYNVSVVIGAHPGAPGLWNGIPSADVRRIAVSVTNPLGETLTLVSYRVNF